ncbi:MAG: arsenate reductase/protein-tyrosine-phosphatase family protein [Bacteroidales bacterium]
MGLFNKISILFVCLGNICRSPAAEGILKQMIISLSLTDNVIYRFCWDRFVACWTIS